MFDGIVLRLFVPCYFDINYAETIWGNLIGIECVDYAAVG